MAGLRDQRGFLTREQGYPVRMYTAGMAGSANVGQSTGFTFVKNGSEPFFIVKDGRVTADEDGNAFAYNKANIALFDVTEGQIIETGQPFTFAGYADSWTKKVVQIDISVDNGET